MFAIPFLIAVAAISLYFSDHPERQARFRRWITSGVMSHQSTDVADGTVVAAHLPSTPQNGGQGGAITGNAVNAELPGNVLPEEVREIVRFWANVEAVEAVIKTGKIGQTEAIEAVFRCKRSGRPDSPYSRAHAAIQARMTTEPRYRPLTAEQEATREALALDR